MRVAAITITLNDDYKFEEWCKYYEEYKDEIYLHIIVDNGSKPTYISNLESFFIKSIIIKRNCNGGCTGAYNDGIAFALKNEFVDSIMLIGNDLRLKKGAISILWQYLYSNPHFGMVGPILLKKDSCIIEDYGIRLKKFGRSIHENLNQELNELIPTEKLIDCVPGGACLAKRIFYEKIGLQDENLFMYCDERDISIRAKRDGFEMGVTARSIAWHQHINPPNNNYRNYFSSYLLGRNFIYLARKHYNLGRAIVEFMYRILLQTAICCKNIKDKERRIHYLYYCKGLWCGLVGNMNNQMMQK